MSLEPRFLERLAAQAVAEGLADGVFASFSSPIGTLTVIQTERGLCRVAFEEEDVDETLIEAAKVLGPRLVSSEAQLKELTGSIAAYLEGDLTDLKVPVDMSLVRSVFQREVLAKLTKVPRGRVATYSELAQRVGRPRAVRATGTALARNPIPIVVPCHRVLPMSGGVGKYAGGSERKRWLLDLEGAPMSARK